MWQSEFAPRQCDSRARTPEDTDLILLLTDCSPFCLNFVASDTRLCLLHPVAGKANHLSVLTCLLKGIACLQSHCKGWEDWAPGWAFRNDSQNQTANRPPRGGNREPPPYSFPPHPTPSTAELPPDDVASCSSRVKKLRP